MKEEWNWKRKRGCVFRNFVHLVFVTKYRRRVFTAKMLKRLKVIFSEICEQMEVELVEFSGEEDHVHLMICFPPQLAVAHLVGRLKGKSSYFLRREFWPEISRKLWKSYLWSPSYCVVSCGGAPLEVVKQYIRRQKTPN